MLAIYVVDKPVQTLAVYSILTNTSKIVPTYYPYIFTLPCSIVFTSHANEAMKEPIILIRCTKSKEPKHLITLYVIACRRPSILKQFLAINPDQTTFYLFRNMLPLFYFACVCAIMGALWNFTSCKQPRHRMCDVFVEY